MFKKLPFAIYCLDVDLDVTEKAIESMGIQREPAREMTDFEKRLVFPLCPQVTDVKMYMIRITTTKRKYKALIKRVGGKEVY